MLGKDEILGKLYDLKVLHDQRQKIDEEVREAGSDLYTRERENHIEKKANIEKTISYLKSIEGTAGVNVKIEDRDMGYTREDVQNVYTYYLDGVEVAWYTKGDFTDAVVNYNNLEKVTEEKAKNILYNRKEKARKDKVDSLNKQINDIDNEIRSLEKEIQRKTESRGLISRLFGKKKFDDEINGMKADIERLKNTKKKLLEEKKGYEELVVFVDDEEVIEFVKNHNGVVEKLKKLDEEKKKLDEEKAQIQAKRKEANVRFHDQADFNTTKQKEILKELVDPKNAEVLQEIATDPKYGKDINEVAKKVLRAAGLGERKVKI